MTLKVSIFLDVVVSRSKLVIELIINAHALSLIVATIKQDETHIPMNMNPVYQAVKSQTLTQAGKLIMRQ